MMESADHTSSTRPYLIRAIYEWCTDNGLTPYLAVHVDAAVRVPLEHVKDNEIVLNISFDATSGLKLGNDFIEFKARFSGTAREIMVPVDHVIAIYARENGQGMSFPAPYAPVEDEPSHADEPIGAILKLEPVSKERAEPSEPAVSTAAAASSPVKLVSSEKPQDGESDPPPEPPKPGPRPALKRVK